LSLQPLKGIRVLDLSKVIAGPLWASTSALGCRALTGAVLRLK
jgi:crotonobetainyl-CoA:carnitine CoA-transferase CaiB-like acyl-CoA transferase